MLIIDTHIALWVVEGNALLPARAKALIAESGEGVFVSVVSLWEIAIKHKLKRRSGAIHVPARRAREQMQQAGFGLLPVSAAHAEAMDDLPTLHADPFDRLMLAQAFAEPARFVTHDARLSAYGPLVVCV